MPEVSFSGPAGRIEGRFHPPVKDAPVALILHPHPKHGGNMNNKVVYALYRCFIAKGFGALRFNFRGVGRSEGTYDNGEGELSDAAAALDWVQSTYYNANRFWVSGFSFGAWIAMQLLMRRPELEGFVAVSPPANLYDFSFLAPCPVSGQILRGSQDTIAEKTSVENLVHKLQNQKNIKIEYKEVAGADHYFTNQIQDFSEHVTHYLDSRLSFYTRSVA